MTPLDPCDYDLIDETRYPDWHDDARDEERREPDEEDDGGVDDVGWYR